MCGEHIHLIILFKIPSVFENPVLCFLCNGRRFKDQRHASEVSEMSAPGTTSRTAWWQHHILPLQLTTRWRPPWTSGTRRTGGRCEFQWLSQFHQLVHGAQLIATKFQREKLTHRQSKVRSRQWGPQPTYCLWALSLSTRRITAQQLQWSPGFREFEYYSKYWRTIMILTTIAGSVANTSEW